MPLRALKTDEEIARCRMAEDVLIDMTIADPEKITHR